MGASARPVIEAALTANGVQTRLGVGVAAIGRDAVTLSTGETLAASSVVWCAGMRADPLTADLGVPCLLEIKFRRKLVVQLRR
jgi:NADH:quinone reductase (non-electrogenic)